MWPKTHITQLLKIKLPIILGPMGGISTPELVAAVSNAGGLGSFGAGYLSPEAIRISIKEIKSLTDKPFAVNLFIPEKHMVSQAKLKQMSNIVQKLGSKVLKKMDPVHAPFAYSFDEQVEVLLEEKVRIFSFTFGIPNDQWLKKFKANKTILMGTATTLAEAELIEKKGIDAVVAQGCEAGGHRGTFLGDTREALAGNFALIPQLADQLKIPVIAAGGIMDARGILAARILGADAVQMGTAFLTCKESGAHPKYKKLLLQAKADNTVLTRGFSGKWARGLRNKFIEDIRIYDDKILPYPIQNALTKQLRAEAAKKGQMDYLSMWAGQAAFLCENENAMKIMKRLDNEMKRLTK